MLCAVGTWEKPALICFEGNQMYSKKRHCHVNTFFGALREQVVKKLAKRKYET